MVTNSYGTGRLMPPVPPEHDPIVGTKDLPTYGINYSMGHLRRMWNDGRFPRPFNVSANRLGWRRSTILKWIEGRTRPPEQ